MGKKTVSTLSILCFVFSSLLITGVFAEKASATALNLLGPEKCERTRGRPDVYSFEFSALPEQEGLVAGTLLVWNGSTDWQHQVSSAVIWVNGEKVLVPRDFNPDVDVLQVPLSNLGEQNTIKVVVRGKPGSYLTLQIAEMGAQGPMFSGPHQYPFVCRTEQSGLGQPLVDNYYGEGITVYEEDETGTKTETLAGYCKDCSMVTRVDYFYRSTEGKFKPIERFAEYPTDLVYTETNEGKEFPYIVRLERGTINRFIYGLAILDPWDEDGESMEAWNQKFFYKFSGGVAIGHDQGELEIDDPLYDVALERGYAVAYSTGNRTGVHYNLQLAGETAIMVKEHFVNRFGEPEFTMSVGGSGGAIQQYIFAQNHPGLLDGIIPQRSYSDMITQSIYVGDCMLMEFYFDVLAPAQGDESFGGFAVDPATGEIRHLGSPEKRQFLEGMSTSDTEPHPIYTPIMFERTGEWYTGSTEAVNGWLGLTPLVMNPLFTDVSDLEQFPDDVVLSVKWTHWDDLKNIYGIDYNGYAPSTWDNVGVQYGLESLRNGDISLEVFLQINAMIGGWKKPEKMVPEGYPFSAWNEIQYLLGPANPMDFDPWSIRNSNFSTEGIAPRTGGDVEAMRDAYESGQVFIGKLNIPAIDIRDYLDPELDMHHAQQSFATRQRVIEYMGSSENQLVWMKDPSNPVDITVEAIELMDVWLSNIQANPGLSVSENRPASGAVDKCFCEDGSVYSGPAVWDGILNDKDEGDCTKAFPLYSTSRIIAGGDIGGDVFKCHLISVEEAIDLGFYGDLPISDELQQQLEAIFPNGVCDYSQGDVGRPADL